MIKYILYKELECPKCKGMGWNPNPKWTQPNIQWDKDSQGRVPTTAYEILQAWKRVETYWFKRTSSTDRADWPPENINCRNCNATGIIQETFEFTQEELESLIDKLRKCLI